MQDGGEGKIAGDEEGTECEGRLIAAAMEVTIEYDRRLVTAAMRVII